MIASQPQRQPGRRRPASSRGGVERALLVVTSAVALVALVACAAAGVMLLRRQAAAEIGKPVQIEIRAGSSSAQIARTLARSGVVRNSNLFRLHVGLVGAAGKLKPGVYDLTQGLPDSAVIAKLEAGPPTEYFEVTIPEGFTIAQIAARLESKAGIPADKFLTLASTGAPRYAAAHPYLSGAFGGSLEGYLFPKTYRIKKGTTADQAIAMMLDQFDKEIAQVDVGRVQQQQGLSLPQVVTIASMIERESRLPRERALVSSVIRNRLAIHKNLEIDATIQYVLPENKIRLSGADIHLNSPYNTYTHAGLPPGPIANPGLSALQAAAAPADTSYLYYVLTGKDGSHTFTTNLADFLVAKKKSIQLFGR